MTTVDNMKSMDYKYKGILKILHRNFPKAYLEEIINKLSIGMHSFMILDKNGNSI